MYCFALKTIVICTNNGLDIKILYINLNVCGTIIYIFTFSGIIVEIMGHTFAFLKYLMK